MDAGSGMVQKESGHHHHHHHSKISVAKTKQTLPCWEVVKAGARICPQSLCHVVTSLSGNQKRDNIATVLSFSKYCFTQYNADRHLQTDSSPHKNKNCHYVLMSFQNGMTFFLPWEQKNFNLCFGKTE